jgi:hypothetical protein
MLTLERTSLNLSQQEIEDITNGLTQPAAQLRELHRRGFVRASRPRGGAVVLSRAHYLAVEQSRPAPEAHGGPAGGVVADLQAWASKRGQRGQKTQGR